MLKNMQIILLQFGYRTIIIIILISIIILLLLFFKKAGILIKKISVKIKNLISVNLKINHKKHGHTGIILSKTEIDNSEISDMNGNINMRKVKIKDSKVKRIKGK